MKPSEALTRIDKEKFDDLGLKIYIMEILQKHEKIQKIIKQNSFIPKYDSDVDAESFKRIRKVVNNK